MTTTSEITGGALVMQNLFSTRLGRVLTDTQAHTLWQECRKWLEENDSIEVMSEIEESRSGRLDTYPRDYALASIAYVLTGQDWPCNMTSEKETQLFVAALKKSVVERGYVKAEVVA